MSEPSAQAERFQRLSPDVLHWSIQDERIGFRSDAYAVVGSDGSVLIDPLPLVPQLTVELEPVRAIVITGGFHQRSCWSARRRFGAPVFSPLGARGLEEQPDEWFGDRAPLPAGLIALERNGPTQPHYVLTFVAGDGMRVLFCADLLMRDRGGPFSFVPDDHQDDPALSRRSVLDLVSLDPDTLCPAHGAPSIGGATSRMQQALDRDRGTSTPFRR